MENVIEQLRKKYTLESTIDSVKGIVTPVFMRLSLGGVVDKFNSLPEEYRTDSSASVEAVLRVTFGFVFVERTSIGSLSKL